MTTSPNQEPRVLKPLRGVVVQSLKRPFCGFCGLGFWKAGWPAKKLNHRNLVQGKVFPCQSWFWTKNGHCCQRIRNEFGLFCFVFLGGGLGVGPREKVPCQVELWTKSGICVAYLELGPLLFFVCFGVGGGREGGGGPLPEPILNQKWPLLSEKIEKNLGLGGWSPEGIALQGGIAEIVLQIDLRCATWVFAVSCLLWFLIYLTVAYHLPHGGIWSTNVVVAYDLPYGGLWSTCSGLWSTFFGPFCSPVARLVLGEHWGRWYAITSKLREILSHYVKNWGISHGGLWSTQRAHKPSFTTPCGGSWSTSMLHLVGTSSTTPQTGPDILLRKGSPQDDGQKKKEVGTNSPLAKPCLSLLSDVCSIVMLHHASAKKIVQLVGVTHSRHDQKAQMSINVCSRDLVCAPPENCAVWVQIITGSLFIIENVLPKNYRNRYRLEIRMNSFNYHYRYRLASAVTPSFPLIPRYHFESHFEWICQSFHYRYRLEMFLN